MKGMLPHSSLFASGDHRAATAGLSPASFNEAEPTHLHDVDIYVWEISYQSATATHNDTPTPFVAYLGSYASSPSATDSSPSSHPRQPQSPNEDNSQHSSVSPIMPGTIDSRLANAAPEDFQPAHDQDIRRTLCPECRSYTSKRTFNMNRHRKACHKKGTSGRSKGTENSRSRVSSATLFRD
ncbi:uncharacterized protein BKA55DRAFT_559748 [Fusarium redolens]|uniref:Uncharacterized protein n=1 Tax=Fusarium redolens TaxID=48865 RepID=A0A9P9HNI4_FUSRE|nr:uncharacterized protein BKA55DRAFT_559748 [Fusarium redolens]KAH7260780.1 hypothetical protein BKA55DRAFT_559748 [Fusarium redolens]